MSKETELREDLSYRKLLFEQAKKKLEDYLKPKPDLLSLTPLIVWDDNKNINQLRYFSHFESGLVHCFTNRGKSGSTMLWKNYRVDHTVTPLAGMLPICNEVPEAEQYLVKREDGEYLKLCNRIEVLSISGHYKVLK